LDEKNAKKRLYDAITLVDPLAVDLPVGIQETA